MIPERYRTVIAVLLLAIVAVSLIGCTVIGPREHMPPDGQIKVIPSTPKPEGCIPYGPDAQGNLWLCGLA